MSILLGVWEKAFLIRFLCLRFARGLLLVTYLCTAQGLWLHHSVPSMRHWLVFDALQTSFTDTPPGDDSHHDGTVLNLFSPSSWDQGSMLPSQQWSWAELDPAHLPLNMPVLPAAVSQASLCISKPSHLEAGGVYKMSCWRITRASHYSYMDHTGRILEQILLPFVATDFCLKGVACSRKSLIQCGGFSRPQLEHAFRDS